MTVRLYFEVSPSFNVCIEAETAAHAVAELHSFKANIASEAQTNTIPDETNTVETGEAKLPGDKMAKARAGKAQAAKERAEKAVANTAPKDEPNAPPKDEPNAPPTEPSNNAKEAHAAAMDLLRGAFARGKADEVNAVAKAFGVKKLGAVPVERGPELLAAAKAL